MIMKKWTEGNLPRRGLAMVLCLCMVLSLMPVFTFAEEGYGTCAHHSEHTVDCGYVAAVAGHDCGHQHDDSCGYQEARDCTHQHTEECGEDGSSCIHDHDDFCGYQAASSCNHQHDETCGYTAAVTGQPCGFVCAACASEKKVAQVQALIDALPETVTEETMESAWSALADVDAAKSALTVDEQVMLDMTRYTALQEMLEAPNPPAPEYTGWLSEDGNWYYLEEGVKLTGWQNAIPGSEGKWFYFDPETGAMQTGWQNAIPGWEGKWLYFDPETGAMQTGLQNGIPGCEGKWLYFDPEMQTGWQNGIPGYEGKWFYFDPETGAMQTDLNSDIPDYVDSWYYFDPETGAMQTGGGQSQGSTFNGSPAEVDENGNLLINETNFPDESFRDYIKEKLTNGKDRMSAAEVAAVDRIHCSLCHISNLKGIEYFTALTFLGVDGNNLSSLDVSRNTALTELVLRYNQLTSLDVSKNTALKYLDCMDNQLDSLDVSKNTSLIALDCCCNQLVSLDVSMNTDLSVLWCAYNQLSSLDVSRNTKLTELYCSDNRLSSLDVSNKTELTMLWCNSNQLTSLNVSGNTKLGDLICSNNKLAALDLTGLQIISRNVTSQTPDVLIIPRDGKLTFDLGSLVGRENLSRVQDLTGGTMDSSGIVAIPAPADLTADIQVSYKYRTLSGYSDLLPVTLTLTPHITHSIDENGDCICGLVKQVPYVDAKGNSLGTQVCTILTEDSTTLEDGWYVATGSVTVGRLTCSGGVNLILEDGCSLTAGNGIRVSNGRSLDIYAQSTEERAMGKLFATAGNGLGEAGIGCTPECPGGYITIHGGVIDVHGGKYGAGIGGNSSSGSYVSIHGGVVKAYGNGYGAGIGSSGGGKVAAITITGGIVTAVGGDSGPGIGSWDDRRGGTFSTGAGGNAVIFASSIETNSKKLQSGVIFEGEAGKVYGSPQLPHGLPIPAGTSLTLDMNSKSLIFAQGTGIALGSGSTLKLTGPGSFPNGISVTGGTLADLLSEGWLFVQGGKEVPVEGKTSLSGATRLIQLPVTITQQPEEVIMTYGEAKALSVTAEPTTSGSMVTYQWYRVEDDIASKLTGETKSTLSLSALSVGSYQFYCAVTCQGFAVNSDTVSVTVGKAASSVTITGDPGKTYDGLPAMLNQDMYTATGGAVKVEYKLREASDSTYTMSIPKNVGDYTVRVTAAADANHTADSDTKDFSIKAKEVTITVTVMDKRFDGTTDAEIETATLNGIVEGDEVTLVNGTPTFAHANVGEDISVSFTEFSLEGTDAGNYDLAQPTGITGKIKATVNYLNLTNEHDFDNQTEIAIGGVVYPIRTDNGRYVILPAEGDLLTIYTYVQGSSQGTHENYPTGMAVYRITRAHTGATVEKIDALDDLLRYSGCSIRITGKRGIRMITSLTKDNKAAMKKEGLDGFTLEEYGTVLQWTQTLGGQSLTLETGKHNYAYKRGVADPVFANSGNLTQYTNVLVGFTLDQCANDIVMRPYIILKDVEGQTVTLYGGTVTRSIGYIAYQNRATFNPGTAAYEYVWNIIHAVYGDMYDNEYQK